MKKLLAAAVLSLVPCACMAGNVNVYDGGSEDQKIIFTTDDDGYTHIQSAHKINDNQWIVFDGDGHSSMVNDFSTPSRRDKDD